MTGRIKRLIKAIEYYRDGLDEMSFPKKKAKLRLDGLSYEIANHLMLLCLYPDCESWNHWRAEVEKWRRELTRLNSGKSPGGENYTKAALMMHAWVGPFSTAAELRVVADQVADDEGLEEREPDPAYLKKIANDFCDCVLGNRKFEPEKPGRHR